MVCRDLVLYDTPRHNLFRELVPLTYNHPVLLQTIIANSALHMSNTHQKSILLSGSTTPLTGSGSSRGQSRDSTASASSYFEAYHDALAAKQRALQLLQGGLARIASANVDVTLAVMLLLINLELIDTGRDNWRYHIRGTRTLIRTLCGPEGSMKKDMSPLRSCLISNCLMYVDPMNIDSRH